MDFGDILSFLAIIGIPLVKKSLDQKKKIDERNKKRNQSVSVNKIEPRDRKNREENLKQKSNKKSIFEQITDTINSELDNLKEKDKGIKDNKKVEELVEYEDDFKIAKEDKTLGKEKYRTSDVKDESIYGESIKDEIKNGEIGTQIDLDFSSDALIKGIIMSEILSKPKSMRIKE
ncbi:hypothetical protein [Clostridiisalibacter paucivorans]|uniref:hypothetical protein n=1 Tax=Clostridiisalibacter paucivorans TaxID=408753 RepID=UPI00047B08A8|nr:hypothetical protein [Clostridiisalibacter paucivorans]